MTVISWIRLLPGLWKLKIAGMRSTHGNYSYYLEERVRRYEQLRHAYENQQKKIKQMEEAIKRLYQWGHQSNNEKFFKRAKSMQKSLDRMERLERPVLDGKQMQLEFEVKERSGRKFSV